MEPEQVKTLDKDGDSLILSRETALQLMFELATELGYEVTLAVRPLGETVN